jgi:hypothetical protein
MSWLSLVFAAVLGACAWELLRQAYWRRVVRRYQRAYEAVERQGDWLRAADSTQPVERAAVEPTSAANQPDAGKPLGEAEQSVRIYEKDDPPGPVRWEIEGKLGEQLTQTERERLMEDMH